MEDETQDNSIGENLATGLAIAQSSATTVENDGKAGNMYKYPTQAAIACTARGSCNNGGISIRLGRTWMTVEEGLGIILHSIVHITHKSGEIIEPYEVIFPVIPTRGQPLDKAMAAAWTSLRKYALAAALNMGWHDDGADIDQRNDAEYEPPVPTPQAPVPPQETAPDWGPLVIPDLDAVEWDERKGMGKEAMRSFNLRKIAKGAVRRWQSKIGEGADFGQICMRALGMGEVPKEDEMDDEFFEGLIQSWNVVCSMDRCPRSHLEVLSEGGEQGFDMIWRNGEPRSYRERDMKKGES